VQKIPLLLIFLGHVWVDTSQGILPIVLVKLKELFYLNYFQVGLVMMVLNLTSSVIQPVFGYVSDHLRTGWFVPLGILWTALAMGLVGWAPSYPVVVLFVGFAGLGTAAFHPRAMMAVYLISGSRRGLGAAVFSTGGNLGFALGPVVGSLLVLKLGMQATLGLLIPGVLLFLLIFCYPGDFLKREALPQDASEGDPKEKSYPIPWISLMAVCLIVTLRSWVYLSFITYLPMFLQTRGVHLKTASLMLTLFLVGGAAAGLYGGHLSDRVGRRGVIWVSHLIYPVLASLMILANGPSQWILALTSGAALLASFSVTIVLAQELLPRHLGLASGLILGLGFGTGGLGSAISGYLADKLGLYQTVWILAFAPLLAVILTAFIRAKPKSYQAAPLNKEGREDELGNGTLR
jgi:FSR family fosmidomycin resistance protein-like MFS transporter